VFRIETLVATVESWVLVAVGRVLPKYGCVWKSATQPPVVGRQAQADSSGSINSILHFRGTELEQPVNYGSRSSGVCSPSVLISPLLALWDQPTALLVRLLS